MLTNNMSNANTPGFKADLAAMRAFPDMKLQRFDKERIPTENGLNLPFSKEIGTINTGVYMQEAIPKFIQGDLRETGRKTDVALQDINMPENGSVFFTVRHMDGSMRYTRNGSFTVNEQGNLTTGGGHLVLDADGQPIQLSSDRFSINEAGVLSGENGETAILGVGYASNAALQLIKEGDGLYRTADGIPQLPDAFAADGVRFRMQQGFLEQSNVDMSRTMTDMMTAYRAFEANQKVLQAYDRSMEKAANEIGRL